MTRSADPKSKTNRIALIGKDHERERIKAFKEIHTRNGIEMSKTLMDAVDRFLKEHNWPPGNSQTVLKEFIGDPMLQCESCKGMVRSLTRVRFISGLEQSLCDDCLQREQDKGPYCTIQKILKVIH